MEKKRKASIRVRDIEGISIKKSEIGDDLIDISVKSAQYEIGYETSSNKLRFDFISPDWTIKNWLDELNYDGYFCFVDTNLLTRPATYLNGCTHATGIYIFQLETVEIQRTQDWTDLTWKPDWRRSVITFMFTKGPDDDAEERGWAIAHNELNKLGATTAKIFVDKHQNRLIEFSKSLPSGWAYYYVSSERGETLFNLIFRRLDKAINIVSRAGPGEFSKGDLERYLMGNDLHLKKSRRS